MLFRHKVKIFAVILTTAYSTLAFAQPQPQANGSSLNETAPSDITTMDPMDPARDSSMGSDATQDRRARAPAVSGTVTPETITPQNPTY